MTHHDGNDRERSSKLYRALWRGKDDDEVLNLCKDAKDGPFFTCTIYKNTVLHKAIYMKRHELAMKLLDEPLVDGCLNSKLYAKNGWGDTLLHHAATSDKGIRVTEKLLQKAPGLLCEENKWGETAVFQATRYGKDETFNFLAKEILNRHQIPSDDHFRLFMRKDKTSVLHMAILTRNFDLALRIAQKYPKLWEHLRDHEDDKKMTPLQLLACSPTAFKSGAERGSFLKELIYSSVDPGEEVDVGMENEVGIIQKVVSVIVRRHWKVSCILPSIGAIEEMKREHKRAEQLAKRLVQSDFSWENGHPPTDELVPRLDHDVHNNNFLTKDDDLESGTRSQPEPEIPLILAAKYGCYEIAKEIIDRFPQAMDYLNRERQGFLHVAIKNRNLKIFKLVDPETTPMRGQLRTIDINGNSILHMVGSKSEKTQEDSKIKSPVIQLSEDLQLLEYLKTKSTDSLIHHRNNEALTADELFATNNQKLREDAKEWLKRTAEHCTVVIVLVATVAFAAAYTIPGGPNSRTGYPLLLSKPLFLVFTVADVLSLGFALTAVVIFLAILTSSFQMKEFRRSLPEKLLLGFTLLFLSVSMMMVAFAATIILMINNKERWTKIGVYVVAFFPVCIFMLSYIPLYFKLVESLRDWVMKIGRTLPRIKFDSKKPRNNGNSSTNV